MDFSPAEPSTSHILLLSDALPQPSNSNSDTDESTDTSIAATPSESGTPVVINSRDRSGTIIAPIRTSHLGQIRHPVTYYHSPIPNSISYSSITHHRELPPESPSAWLSLTDRRKVQPNPPSMIDKIHGKSLRASCPRSSCLPRGLSQHN
jgi:hypothetical protein